MREILEQVSNGVDNVDTSIFQDGGQQRGAHASGVSDCFVQNINVTLPQKLSCFVSAPSIGELRLFKGF